MAESQAGINPFTWILNIANTPPYMAECLLFLHDIYDFFANNRPVLSSVQGLQESVHRSVVEATEARATLVRQRADLFGVMAVLGLVLVIITPFMSASLI